MSELRAIESLSDDELRAVQTGPSTSEGRKREASLELARRQHLKQPATRDLPRTIVAGIDVPFLDLVALYIKLMFAAIPAAIIAWVVIFVVRAVTSS